MIGITETINRVVIEIFKEYGGNKSGTGCVFGVAREVYSEFEQEPQ